MSPACPRCGSISPANSMFCSSCGAQLAGAAPGMTPGAPLRLIGTRETAGRTCPYCRFPLKEGGAAIECGACHAIHHQECFTENGGCAVAGCTAGPGSAAAQAFVTPSHAAPTATGVGVPAYGTPAPPAPSPPPTPPRRNRLAPTLIVATMVLLILAGGATALVVSGGGAQTTSSTIASSAAAPASTSASVPATTDTPAQTQPPASTTVSDSSSSTTTVSNVTGTDANGYNVGPGCSDDPSSPDPGCSDSPSTPNGDPEGSCPNGITIDSQTTTCGLAENVYSGYTSDGQVTANSPKTGQSYTFTCQTAGAGTTGYTICQAQDGATPLYLRWHK